eukprot:TRINITY_DN1999_c0_g1_i1.p1 TRINITY_DN1999_c0_g1~~TRINITY_DN1999_c0_g1_i1.p1  ORF type:complete len:468 (+),score=132.02 TRINITY_DN1999_c0_g1_i1:78-1406(+)
MAHRHSGGGRSPAPPGQAAAGHRPAGAHAPLTPSPPLRPAALQAAPSPRPMRRALGSRRSSSDSVALPEFPQCDAAGGVLGVLLSPTTTSGHTGLTAAGASFSSRSASLCGYNLLDLAATAAGAGSCYARISRRHASCSTGASVCSSRAGSVIDGYEPSQWEVGRLLGRGSFGKVHEATHESGAKLAVKVIELGRDGDVDGVLRVAKAEVEIMKTLQHEHIIQMYASVACDDCVCIMMEMATEGSLKTRLRQPLDHGEALQYTEQILRGLAYLHQNDIVHQDVKPENILLCADAERVTLKLADFGLSRVVDAVRSFSGSPAGSPKGTAEYIAPETLPSHEQLQRGEIHVPPYHARKVDIWALGCVVLAMLKLRIWAFSYGGPPGAYTCGLWMHISRSRGPPDGMPKRGECDPRLHKVLELCFERDVDRRPSAAELLALPLFS